MGSPQKNRPIIVKLKEDSGSSYPTITVCFIRKESVKPNFKRKEGLCVLNPNWELGPQKKGLKSEGSASHSTLKHTRNHKEANSLRAKSSKVFNITKVIG